MSDDEKTETSKLSGLGRVPLHRPTRKAPAVSIIISGRNEIDYVRAFPTAQSHLIRAEFELVFVDTGSTDGTNDAAIDIGFKVHAAPASERSSDADLRNRGWRISHGKLLLFLDAGAPYYPEFLPKAMYTMRDETVGAAIPLLRQQRVPGEPAVFSAPNGVADAVGHHALVRRGCMRQLDGFRAAGTPETDFADRLSGHGFALRGVKVRQAAVPEPGSMVDALKRLFPR
ncbi:MAG: glycosyltransferase [Pseudomonadota bacterium]